MPCRGLAEPGMLEDHLAQYCGVDAEFQCWCGWRMPEDDIPDQAHLASWQRIKGIMQAYGLDTISG